MSGFSRAGGNQFDIALRRLLDGLAWQPALSVTPAADDVDPDPLIGACADTVELYRGRGAAPGGSDCDIVREAALRVSELVFADGLDG